MRRRQYVQPVAAFDHGERVDYGHPRVTARFVESAGDTVGARGSEYIQPHLSGLRKRVAPVLQLR
jgi:hypothetical protein